MQIHPFTAAIAPVILAVAPALAAPSLKEDLNGLYKWAQEGDQGEVQAQIGDKISAIFEAHPFESMSPADLDASIRIMLSPFGQQYMDAFTARLDALADPKSADGAAAAVIKAYFEMYRDRTPPEPEAYAKVLAHPGLPAAIKNGSAAKVFETAGIMASNLPPFELGPARAGLDKLAEYITPDMAPESALAAADYIDGMSTLWEDGDKAKALQDKLLDTLRKIRGGMDDDAPLTAEVDNRIKQMTFIGSAAPEINFEWTSDGFDASKLSDLKGRVVVLDFWATWCNPCIAAFPKVRELVEHYDGYPVTVVGVTSLQGAHFDAERQQTDTEGNPDLEHELMKSFIGDMEMTWPVAFSTQEVFNKDYYVTGIPHMVIIAPDGSVRYNGLNPHTLKPGEETAYIDGILKEFNLKAPESEAPAKG